MANRWIANGSSHIQCDTIGNIVGPGRVYDVTEVKFDDVIWSESTGYAFCVGGSTAGTRELAVFTNGGTVTTIVGGASTNLPDSFSTIFGSAQLSCDELAMTFNVITGNLDIKVDGAHVGNSPYTVNVGTSRIVDYPFRIGCRGSGSDPLLTTGSFFVANGDKFGDTIVTGYTGATPTEILHLTMPSSGTSIPDSVAANDATLYNGTGGGADWEELAGLILIVPVYNSVDLVTRLATKTLTGQYFITPVVSMDWREMDGLTVVQDWAPVTSFGGNVFTIDLSLASGTLHTIEVRLDDGTTVTTLISNPFSTGIGIALTGSSSGERFVTSGAGTVDVGYTYTVFSPGGSYVQYTNADGAIAGATAVDMANSVFAATGEDVCMFSYGNSGTRMTVSWLPGDALHDQVIAELGAGNVGVSALIDQVGYNDVGAGITINSTQTDAMYDSYRSAFNCPIITGLSQRFITGGQDGTFVALMQSFTTTIDARPWLYGSYRLDLEISGDNIHLTAADSLISGARFTNTINYLAGESSYYTGPVISSVNFAGVSTVIVTLSAVGTSYSAISPASAIAGFQLEDTVGVLTINSVVATSKTKLTIELNSVPVGELNARFAGYEGNVSGLNTFPSYPVDNSSIPYPIAPLFSDMIVAEALSGITLRSGLSIGLGIGLNMAFSIAVSSATIDYSLIDYSADYLI